MLIGTGGWAYFKVKGEDPLEAYSGIFDFVEVNSTFYDYPSEKSVDSWRKRVPESFAFSVKCHRDLTHVYGMEPVEGAQKCLERMVGICRSLEAEILVLQTPSSFGFDDDKVKRIRELLSTTELGKLRLAWEIRTERGRIPDSLYSMMNDNGVIHCVDLSRELPVYDSDIVYTRLFGKGKQNVYQFSDEELSEVRERAQEHVEKGVYYTIHGVRMFKDAARLKTVEKSGKYPMVTKSTGLDSLKEVLSEDAKFPSDRDKLIEDQGWKVVDLTSEKRIHAKEMLERLPDGTYADAQSVTDALKTKQVGRS
jgi:uncharacterized protein YecE (DUF72 family)